MKTRLRPVDILVRLEWVAVFVTAVVIYVLSGGSWLFFLALILAPDLAMLGYLGGPRVGAFAYNFFHILIWPLALAIVGFDVGDALLLQIASVWIAHIAMDRTLGYGLKLPTGFADTHLGRIGKG